MVLHNQWRDCQEWQKNGIKLGTTNNEVAKLYDAAVTQYAGFYDDASVGGFECTLSKMIQDDPNFLMGHVISNGVQIIGAARSPVLDTEFKKSLDLMDELSQKPTVNIWEKKHANAIKLYGEGKCKAACNIWESILLDTPLDLVALKFLCDGYFFMGMHAQKRDCVARVLPYWKPNMPLHGYLYGMHAFGLVETNFYEQAEKQARKALEINEKDAWATHAIVHVMEHQGRVNEGISFMAGTMQDWQFCNMFACHNFWHWGLYHIEKGEYQGAFDIYDSELSKSFQRSGSVMNLVDCASTLLRLEMEGQSVGSRWEDLFEKSRPHIDDHLSTFVDVHLMLALLGSKHKDVAESMMRSMETFIRDTAGDTRDVLSNVGRPMCESFIAYNDGDYAKAVEIMAPLRYDITNIGSSNAQRDEFNIFLINAAIKSPLPDHHKLARRLLAERKALKENSPLTDRMIARSLAFHGD